MRKLWIPEVLGSEDEVVAYSDKQCNLKKISGLRHNSPTVSTWCVLIHPGAMNVSRIWTEATEAQKYNHVLHSPHSFGHKPRLIKIRILKREGDA